MKGMKGHGMVTSVKSITILGAGHIGFAMAVLLRHVGDYEVLVVDRDSERLKPLGALGLDVRVVNDEVSLARAVAGRYAVLNALPFRQAITVAGMCVKARAHYFDLTEDIGSAQAIRALAVNAASVLMPQCGLAPGFIGIVGHDLACRFDSLLDLHLRVGALPRYCLNRLRYNLTWSTEGLINQYCNPCNAIVDGKPTQVMALEGYETFALDGVEYEAFNTSGGLGTLMETLRGKARNVDYKSVRYPGHCAVMKLLLNDLRLRERRDLLKDILEAAIPATGQDVIVVFASASGYRNQRLVEESYFSRMVGAEVDGNSLTAIQVTTAAGICTALDMVASGSLPQSGFIGQEEIVLDEFLKNRFGRACIENFAEARPA